MKMTKEWLVIMQENKWLHGRNLRLQNEVDEKNVLIMQLRDEIIELRKVNNDLHQAFFGEQSVWESGWNTPIDICIRGVHYVLADEYEKLDNIIRDKDRRLEQIKAVANGDNY